MDTTPAANPGLQSWLQQILRESVNLGRAARAREEPLFFSAEKPRIIPPEELPYLLKLIGAILEGRDIVAAYNYTLLALLGIFTVAHVFEKRRCRKRRLKRKSGGGRAAIASDAAAEENHNGEPDLERRPLLRSRRQPHAGARSSTLAWKKLQYWVEYQPPPLPVVRRVLPSNGTSLFVLTWLSLNFFFLFYRLPLELEYLSCFADRAGCVFIVNLPLLYLLSAKNQPVAVLTGRSYEALNIFHRRVGEWMCFVAVLHGAGMLAWRIFLEPDWLKREDGFWEYLTHPLILLGIGAFVSYELLFFTSLGSFRQRWYEGFLAAHVVLQVLALIFLYLHFFTAQPYVLAALVIFIVDRVFWRLGLKSATFTSDTHVLPDGETIFMGIEWTLPGPRSRWSLWPRRNIRYGWKPTDHVFLTVPVLGRTHALQAHPFTIASAAPRSVASRSALEDSSRTSQKENAFLGLLIRSHEGFTADLLCYAHRHRTIPVRLDGPYGSSHALDMLRAADHALLVAGGSGIAVTLPLAWALLCDDAARRDNTKHILEERENGDGARMSRGQAVRMLWIIHSDEHRFWVPQAELDGLVAAGLDLVIPPPTSEAGRPDVEGIVEGWIEDVRMDGDSGREEAAMVVSGPDGLNRMVRNTCAKAIGNGANVRLAVEKFGW